MVQCVQRSSQNESGHFPKIDLFEESTGRGAPAVATAAVSADSALKYSTVAGLATQIKLLDSASKKGLYLYSAVIKKIKKGNSKNCKRKEYFIACEKIFPLQDTAIYTFYFKPVIDHYIIKNNLAVKWQWQLHAPLVKYVE